MKTNIMNLMMGTNNIQNSGTVAKEVQGELFSSLLQKAAGLEGTVKDALLDLLEGEPFLEEEEATYEEAITALVGMIFSKMPEETLLTTTPEKLLKEGVQHLQEAHGTSMNAMEATSVKELLSSLGNGHEALQEKVLDALSMKQMELRSSGEKTAESGLKMQSQDLKGQGNAKETEHLVALRTMVQTEKRRFVSTSVDEMDSAVDSSASETSMEMRIDSGIAIQSPEADPLNEEDEMNSAFKKSSINAGIEPVKTQGVKTADGKIVKMAESDIRENLRITEEAMVKSVETMKNGDRTTMKLRLHPEELGEMELTLSMEHGKITGKLLTDSQEIRQIFQGKLLELQETLKNQNIQVIKLEVSANLSESGQNSQGQNHQDEMKRRAQEMTLRGYTQVTEKKSAYSPVALKSQEGISILA